MKARFTTFKLFFMQHFFVVGLVLLFVVLSFCSCGRAAADDFSDYSIYINPLFDEYSSLSDSDIEYLESYIYTTINSECDYFCYRQFDGGIQLFFCNNLNIGVVTSYGAWESPYFPITVKDTSATNITYSITCYNGNYMLARIDGVNSNLSWSGWSWNYSSAGASSSGHFYLVSGTQFSTTDTRFSLNNFEYGNFNEILILGGRYGYSNSFDFNYDSIELLVPVSYVSDDRLKLSSSLTGDGSKLLNIDLSSFRGSYTPAASYTFSDVVLHLDCDGTVVSYTINSSNSELVNSWNPSNNRYVLITPYSVFDLASYDDVFISGVDFSLTHSSPGGSDTEDFKISAEYFLKHDTAPIVSEDIVYDNDVVTDKFTVEEIQKIDDDIQIKSGSTFSIGTLPDIAFPDNFDVYRCDMTYNTSEGSISDWLSDIGLSDLLNLPASAFDYVDGISSSSDAFTTIVEPTVKNNLFCNCYDALVFVYYTQAGGLNPDAPSYYYVWYYVTESGRLRVMSSMLADICKDTNQTAYNSYAIYDYMYTRLDDFENKSILAFNTLIGLDRDQVQWLSTLNNSLDFGFDSVVDAINNIDIPEPTVFDDTDILDKLDDLLTAVQDLIDGNEVDTPQECIQYYYDNQNGTIDLAFVPAYYEGMTLDFLYSIQGENQNNLRSGAKSGGGPAVLVNNSLLIQIFNQFKDSFTDNFIPQNIRVFLSNITNDTSNHMYYFQLFHNDYDPEDFDGLAD